jgi:hypothetical protein
LSQNAIPEIPDSVIDDLPAIQRFNASGMGLTGTVSKKLKLSRWAHLRALDLSSNHGMLLGCG